MWVEQDSEKNECRVILTFISRDNFLTSLFRFPQTPHCRRRSLYCWWVRRESATGTCWYVLLRTIVACNVGIVKGNSILHNVLVMAMGSSLAYYSPSETWNMTHDVIRVPSTCVNLPGRESLTKDITDCTMERVSLAFTEPWGVSAVTHKLHILAFEGWPQQF